MDNTDVQKLMHGDRLTLRVKSMVLTGRLNLQLRGWANDFNPGHPRQAFRDLHSCVRAKLTWHLQRRSQRSWRPPGGTSAHAHLNRMGLIQL